jgi:xanthine dehydrogenase accessory factor
MVDAAGSVPNRPGAKLLITGDGERSGTVGGGPTEETLAGRAQAMLAPGERGRSEVLEVEHTEEGTGSLCSGTQTFAVLRLEPEDEAAVAEIVRAIEEGAEGTVRIDRDGVSFLRGHASGDDSAPVRRRAGAGGVRWQEADGAWRYEEPVSPVDLVTIVGGGHVSLALSRLLDRLGFRVVVLDDRPDLDTMRRNTFARERRVIDYDEVADHVPEGDRSYACIMTFGHTHDEAVLRALVDRPLRYLGMMGSPAKVAAVFSHLRAAGVPDEALARVRAPIGAPIGSNTPDEIAVSVAAELLAVRSGCDLPWRKDDTEASP